MDSRGAERPASAARPRRRRGVTPGDPIVVDGAEVGALTSVAGTVALGLRQARRRPRPIRPLTPAQLTGRRRGCAGRRDRRRDASAGAAAELRGAGRSTVASPVRGRAAPAPRPRSQPARRPWRRRPARPRPGPPWSRSAAGARGRRTRRRSGPPRRSARSRTSRLAEHVLVPRVAGGERSGSRATSRRVPASSTASGRHDRARRAPQPVDEDRAGPSLCRRPAARSSARSNGDIARCVPGRRRAAAAASAAGSPMNTVKPASRSRRSDCQTAAATVMARLA